MLVPPSAFAALQQYARFACLIHIRHNPSGGVISDHRAYRYLDQQIFPAPAGTAVAGTVAPVFSGIFAAETEIQQCMHVFIRQQNHIPAMAAIAAVIAFASCFFGDFLTSVHYIAQSEELGYFETLQVLEWKYFFEIATLGFDAITGLFYIFAIGEAFSIVRGKKKEQAVRG